MPAAQHFQRIISADSHVMEPLDLWWNALGQKVGDRTPRYLSQYQGHQGNFFYTGYQGWPVSWLRDNRPETERAAVDAAVRGHMVQDLGSGLAGIGLTCYAAYATDRVRPAGSGLI
jgi:hypothetical protein